jgi:Raf kinase inhibitor-like YbhB/YbcL family protein
MKRAAGRLFVSVRLLCAIGAVGLAALSQSGCSSDNTPAGGSGTGSGMSTSGTGSGATAGSGTGAGTGMGAGTGSGTGASTGSSAGTGSSTGTGTGSSAGAGSSTGAGSGSSATDAGASPDATITGGAFALTSPAFMGLVVPDGGPYCIQGDAGTIPTANTCAGANISPELDWTPGPAGTKSYTLIFRDLCNSFGHWAVWDIPASVSQLPVIGSDGGPTLAMPAGVNELRGNGPPGYMGPCPNETRLHVYEFRLYALDVDTNGVKPAGARVDGVETAVTMSTHAKAMATLAGTSNAHGKP